MQTEELRSHLEHVAGEIRVDTASAWPTVRERATRPRRHARIAGVWLLVAVVQRGGVEYVSDAGAEADGVAGGGLELGRGVWGVGVVG